MRYKKNPGWTSEWTPLERGVSTGYVASPEDQRAYYKVTRDTDIIRGGPTRFVVEGSGFRAFGLSFKDAKKQAIEDARAKLGRVSNPSKVKKKKRSQAFQIQEVLLERDHFTPARARAWLQKNGHKYGDLTESDRFYHARQFSPGDYRRKTLHNIQIAKHVEAVVGIPEGDTPAANARGYNKHGPRQTKLPLTRKAPYTGYSEEYGF